MAIKETQRQSSIQRDEMTLAMDDPQEIELVYDYAQVVEEYRPTVVSVAKEIKFRVQRSQRDLLAVGRRLLYVKDYLPHGQFQNWVESEFDLSYRMARNLMNVAETYAGKSEIISLFNDTTLYLLAAPSTPEEARQEIETQAKETGKSPTVTETKRAIERHSDRPEYAEVWELERAIEDHMRKAGWGDEDCIHVLRKLKDEQHHSFHWESVTQGIGQSFRKKDVLQAVANVLERYRREEEPVQPADWREQPRLLSGAETEAVIWRVMGVDVEKDAESISWVDCVDFLVRRSHRENYEHAVLPGCALDRGVFGWAFDSVWEKVRKEATKEATPEPWREKGYTIEPTAQQRDHEGNLLPGWDAIAWRTEPGKRSVVAGGSTARQALQQLWERYGETGDDDDEQQAANLDDLPVAESTEQPPAEAAVQAVRPRVQSGKLAAAQLANLQALRDTYRDALDGLSDYEKITGHYSHSPAVRRALQPVIETLDRTIKILEGQPAEKEEVIP